MIKLSGLNKLLIVIIIILIINNIISFNVIRKADEKATIVSDNAMSNHYVVFSDARYPNGFYETMQDPMKYSDVISQLNKAVMWYRIAESHVEDKVKQYYWKHVWLLGSYIDTYDSYRYYLHETTGDEFDYDIELICSDLEFIADWLIERYRMKEFTIYNDEEFYNEVFINLQSELAQESLQFGNYGQESSLTDDKDK